MTTIFDNVNSRGYPLNTDKEFLQMSIVSNTTKLISIDDIVDNVVSFMKLKDNWDLYGSSRINRQCVLRSIEFMSYIKRHYKRSKGDLHVPFAAPCTDGSIQLEWEIGNRYLEVNIPKPPKNIEYYRLTKDPDNTQEVEGLIQDVNKVLTLIDWVTVGTSAELTQEHNISTTSNQHT